MMLEIDNVIDLDMPDLSRKETNRSHARKELYSADASQKTPRHLRKIISLNQQMHQGKDRSIKENDCWSNFFLESRCDIGKNQYENNFSTEPALKKIGIVPCLS